MSREDPDDEELRQTLVRGVVFHAIHGREALVAEKRRSLAAAEPLPPDLATALAELAEEIAEQEIFTLSLHLVLADAIAAGLVPEGVPPSHVVAASAIALVHRDEPDDEIDVRHMARYVRASPRRLERLARRLLPVLDWTPPDDDSPAELRQQERWRMASSEIQFMPARWLPAPGTERPPYTEEAARARLRELPDVVWLMPEPFEAVRFVAECFSYGGDAPDELDAEVVREIVELWKREQVAGSLFMDGGDEWDDDELEDDDWDDKAT